MAEAGSRSARIVSICSRALRRSSAISAAIRSGSRRLSESSRLSFLSKTDEVDLVAGQQFLERIAAQSAFRVGLAPGGLGLVDAARFVQRDAFIEIGALQWPAIEGDVEIGGQVDHPQALAGCLGAADVALEDQHVGLSVLAISRKAAEIAQTVLPRLLASWLSARWRPSRTLAARFSTEWIWAGSIPARFRGCASRSPLFSVVLEPWARTALLSPVLCHPILARLTPASPLLTARQRHRPGGSPTGMR